MSRTRLLILLRTAPRFCTAVMCCLLGATASFGAAENEPASGKKSKIDIDYKTDDGFSLQVKEKHSPAAVPVKPGRLSWEAMEAIAKEKATKVSVGGAGLEVTDKSISVSAGVASAEATAEGVTISAGVGSKVPNGSVGASVGLKAGTVRGPPSELYGKEGENLGIQVSAILKGKVETLTPDGKVQLTANVEQVLGTAQIGWADLAHRKRMKEAYATPDEFVAQKEKPAPKPEAAPLDPETFRRMHQPMVKDAAILFVRPAGAASDAEWIAAARAMQQEFARLGKPLDLNVSMSEVLVRDQGYSSDEINRMERHFRIFNSRVRLGEKKWPSPEQTSASISANSSGRTAPRQASPSAAASASPTPETDDERKYWEAPPQFPKPDIEESIDGTVRQFYERYELFKTNVLANRSWYTQRGMKITESDYFHNMENSCHLVQSWRGVYYPYYGHIWKKVEKKAAEMEAILASIRLDADGGVVAPPVPDEFKGYSLTIASFSISLAKSQAWRDTLGKMTGEERATAIRGKAASLRHDKAYLQYLLGTPNLSASERQTATRLLAEVDALLPEFGG